MEAKGNVVDHEYKIERDGDKVAEVSKRWFRVRDTYGIEVAPGQDDALLLAAAVCIDRIAKLNLRQPLRTDSRCQRFGRNAPSRGEDAAAPLFCAHMGRGGVDAGLSSGPSEGSPMPESGLPIRVYKENDMWHVDLGDGLVRGLRPPKRRPSRLPTRWGAG